MPKQVTGLVICIAAFAMSAAAQTVIGSGTTNTVPVFTGASTVGNSPITVSGGNVGIGTAGPTGLFSVGPTVRGYSAFTVDGLGNTTVGSINAPSTTPAQLIFGNYQNTGVTRPYVLFNNQLNWSGIGQADSANDSNLRLGATPSPWQNWGTFGALSFNLSIDGGLSVGTASVAPANGLLVNGNVGIGTTNPGAMLDVNGNARVQGTLLVTGTGGLEVASGGILFPDGTTQTTAYPVSSAGGSAPIQIVNNEAVVNNGINPNGSGLKHIRLTTSPLPQTVNRSTYLPFAISFSQPFADPNYTSVCSITNQKSLGSGYSAAAYLSVANKTVSSIDLILVNPF